MNLAAGMWIQLRNGWIVGPLIARTAPLSGGGTQQRFTVSGGCAGMDWEAFGGAYQSEYDAMTIKEAP